MQPRLASGIWVAAYLRRLDMAGIPAFITARGDETSGAVIVKCAMLNGQARAWQRSYDLQSDQRIWMVLAEGDEPGVDQAIARARQFDRDLWVIELENRNGDALLKEDGLN